MLMRGAGTGNSGSCPSTPASTSPRGRWNPPTWVHVRGPPDARGAMGDGSANASAEPGSRGRASAGTSILRGVRAGRHRLADSALSRMLIELSRNRAFHLQEAQEL